MPKSTIQLIDALANPLVNLPSKELEPVEFTDKTLKQAAT
jgi:hypothetical protein